MKKLLGVVVASTLMVCSVGKASIVHLDYADDGDGAFVCPPYTWDGTNSFLSVAIDGVQSGLVGHVLGTINTDTAEDPKLQLNNSVDNDLWFAWTAYKVNVYMSSPFTITNASVTTPGDWTVASVVQPTNTSSNYVGQIHYASGTPVAIGGQLDYSYTVVFSGSTTYSICQEVLAIPEPSTLALVMAAGLMFGGIVIRKHRKSKTAV